MSISIPSLHISTKSKAKGSAQVTIPGRGDFKIKIDVNFNPPDYPGGSMTISTNMNDSIKAVFTASTVELVNSFGKITPVIYLTGRCKVDLSENTHLPIGCKYWVMIANNKSSDTSGASGADIVGFAIQDGNGNKVAYGTGPVTTGDIAVSDFGA